MSQTVILTNPWSKVDVVITDERARARLDDCLTTFATPEEIYHCEGVEGVKAITALIDNIGADRMSDIWFS